MRALALLACLFSASALAADILAARYDPAADGLVVEIAYRGTHADHDFALEWGRCAGGEAVARLIDRQGSDLAREDFRVQQRFGLAGLECRPARVTLRLGRVSHATVLVPAGEENLGFEPWHATEAFAHALQAVRWKSYKHRLPAVEVLEMPARMVTQRGASE